MISRRVISPRSAGESPIWVLTDGEGGTVVGVSSTQSRSKVYNRVVCRAQEQDSAGRPTFQATADQMNGPLRVGGPYGTVTRFYSSPLVAN